MGNNMMALVAAVCILATVMPTIRAQGGTGSCRNVPDTFTSAPGGAYAGNAGDTTTFTGTFNGVTYSCDVANVPVLISSTYTIYLDDCACQASTNYIGTLDVNNPSGETTCSVCFNRAGGNGDPHFEGLDGFSFDFQGEPGHYYNLLSAEDTQANFGIVLRGMHLAEKRGWYQLPSHKNTSTWIGSASFKYCGDIVTVEKNEDMSLTVELNGKPLEHGISLVSGEGMTIVYGDRVHKASDLTHTLYATADDYTTQHVMVDTPNFVFDVDVPPTFSRRMDVWVGLHQQVAELEGQCEGVIGHTIRTTRPFEGTDMEDVYTDVEKVWDESERTYIRYSATLEAEIKAKYETPSLTSDDFPANKYVSGTKPLSRARKLIQRSGAVPVQLPVVASTTISFQ